MRRFLNFLLVIFIIALGLSAFGLYNTLNYKGQQPPSAASNYILISDSAVLHFQEAIRFKTIQYNYNEQPIDSHTFCQFDSFLQKAYPLVQQHLTKTYQNDFSFIYEWRGSDPSLKPALFTAHYDVVPVPKENQNLWSINPYLGIEFLDTVYGRGALDDKVRIISLMESIEYLLEDGYAPKRSIILAFGHDEETGGFDGAKAIASYLESKGVQAEYVLDEGSYITKNLVPGLDQPVALIGLNEKGGATVKLTAQIKGGHSAVPAKTTAIDAIASAIHDLKENPIPARICPSVDAFLEVLGPEMPMKNKLIVANKKWTKPLITKLYSESTAGNALVRTTMATTVFKGGVKDNVIPNRASALLNFRILPGETVDDVVEYVIKTIKNPDITVELMPDYADPPLPSSHHTESYDAIAKTIKQIFPECVIAPSLVVAGTDSRHYRNISDNIYRFSPVWVDQQNINSIHGINERMPVDQFERAIQFYVQLIKNHEQ